MKLAIGTVQFGMKYGVANIKGQPSRNDICEILTLAKNLGIDTLDTAVAYGESESNLGLQGVADFKVVSKLPPIKPDELLSASWVFKHVETSLKQLKLNNLYGYLFHRPLELLSDKGEQAYKALADLKAQGLIRKLGVSVSGPSDLDLLSSHFDFDLVQAPMNIIDRRMMNTGWLKRLKVKGVEIHIRSAFLQGLLLMPSEERPLYFNRWRGMFEQFNNWLLSNNLSSLDASIGFLDNIEEIDRVVVGIDSKEQLSDIFNSIRIASVIDVPDSIQSDDQDLINPALWRV